MFGRARWRHKGLTLVELVVTVFIVAVMLSLTLPGYQRYVQVARRALAGTALMDVMARQEQFFLEQRVYAELGTALGFVSSPHAIDKHGREISPRSGKRVYLIELSTVSGGYVLEARPQLNQAEDHVCGTLSLTSKGVKGVSGSGSVARCW